MRFEKLLVAFLVLIVLNVLINVYGKQTIAFTIISTLIIILSSAVIFLIEVPKMHYNPIPYRLISTDFLGSTSSLI
jgi:hypothetical protein